METKFMSQPYENAEPLTIFQCITNNNDYSFKPHELLHPARHEDVKSMLNTYHDICDMKGIQKSI